MLASVKALLNKFSASQPALQEAGKPAATSGIQLGDEIEAAAAAAAAAAGAEAAAYTPATPGDWNGAPTTTQEAIDRLAAAVAALASGPID